MSAKDDAVVLAIDPADPHAPAGSNVGLGASGLPDGILCAKRHIIVFALLVIRARAYHLRFRASRTPTK